MTVDYITKYSIQKIFLCKIYKCASIFLRLIMLNIILAYITLLQDFIMVSCHVALSDTHPMKYKYLCTRVITLQAQSKHPTSDYHVAHAHRRLTFLPHFRITSFLCKSLIIKDYFSRNLFFSLYSTPSTIIN